MKKLKLKEFQLSQSYLFFWDKLNKSDHYPELSIENADLPVDDRLVNFFARDLSSDGGQWDMVVSLLETYGLVPKPIYPGSCHSNASSPINTLLNVSPESAVPTLRVKKEELMYKIYTIMSASLGVPPKPDAAFIWEHYTEDVCSKGPHAREMNTLAT
ncbi:bleomycin hydrolase [Suillus variegatus]|nr:bleomycin hydrolase [Suillus variegatus]